MSPREFDDAARILWQPYYQLNKFNNYMFHRLGIFPLAGLMLIVMIISGSLAGFRGWGRLAGIGIGLAVAFALFRHMQSANPKLLAKVNASLLDHIDLDENAMTMRAEDGRAVTHPWTLAHWWGRTEHVIMIVFTKSEAYALPLEGLSASDRQAVCDLVQAKLGAPKYYL